MNIGKLRHRISLQKFVKIEDEGGGYSEGWQDVTTVWASIEPLKGRELFEAQQTQTEVNVRIKMRFRKGISPDMRIKFGNRVFEIDSVINVDERNRELQLMCKEVGTIG